MPFDDNAIASGENLNNLKQSYSKLNSFKEGKVETLAEKNVINPEIYNLFTTEIDLLNVLASHSQNQNIKEFLQQLSQKSEKELENLVARFPYLDQSLIQNPVFYGKFNATNNFKKFLETDLEIVDVLGDSLRNISKQEDKDFVFNALNRHIKALEQLFSIMHLLTFY